MSVESSYNYPIQPYIGIPIPSSKEDREVLKEFVRETSKDFVKIGYESVKSMALFGWDVCASVSPVIKELLSKDYEPPQLILDSRHRMHLRWKGIKELCNQIGTLSAERFELDHYNSLHVLHAMTGMEIPKHEHERYHEILDGQRQRASGLTKYFEEFKRLPPGQQAREALKMVYQVFWDWVILKGASATTNLMKYNQFTKPPKFVNTEFRGLRPQYFKGQTAKEVMESISKNPSLANQDWLFVLFEEGNRPVLEFAPASLCNHAELARRANGIMPKLFTTGEVKGWETTESLIAKAIECNNTGHIRSHGKHIPKLTRTAFNKEGLISTSTPIHYTHTAFPFNPERGFIKGYSDFNALPFEGNWQYVLLECVETGRRERKLAPLTEIWKGGAREISIAELSLTESGKLARVIEYGKITNFNNKIEILGPGIAEITRGRNLKGAVLYNPPIFEKKHSLGGHAILEGIREISEFENAEDIAIHIKSKDEADESVKAEDVPDLLDKNLDSEERVAVYETVIQDTKAEKARSAPEKAEELYNHFKQDKIPYQKAAGELARELALVVDSYFHQEEKTTQYEQRRQQLSREFDQLSSLFDLKWSINSFQSMSREEVLHRIQGEIHVDAFERQILMIQEFTREICEHSDRLKQDLETYIQSCNKLDCTRKTLQQIDQSIKEYYDHKLKRWTRASRILNKLSFFTGSAHGISSAIQMIKASATPVTAGLSIASTTLSVTNHMVNRRLQQLTHAYESELGKHKETHQLLGILSDHELNERLRLEQDKRGEGEFLLQNRDFIHYDTYLEKQQNNLRWLDENTKEKSQEIAKKKQELVRLQTEKASKELELRQFGNHIKGEKKIKKFDSLRFEVEGIKLKEEKVKKEIEVNEKIIEGNDKLEKHISDNLNVRKHVSPLVKYREELETKMKLPTEKEMEEQKEFARLLKTLNHNTEVWFQRSIALQGGLRPIMQEVDWWFNSQKASMSLEALMEAYKFGVNGYKVYNFYSSFKKLEGKDSWEKLGKVKIDKLIGKCILPALSTFHISLVVLRLAWNAYHGINTPPQKNPHIEALRFFVEQNQKLLNQRFDELQRNQNWQHGELLDQFKAMHSRFDMATLIDTDNAILESRQKFERRMTKSPTLENVTLQLQHASERNLNGSNFKLNEKPHLDRVIQYPYMYTGFLQAQLGTSKSCSSLYLWDSAVHQLIRYSKEFAGEKYAQQLKVALQDIAAFEELIKLPMKKIEEAQRLLQNALEALKLKRSIAQQIGQKLQSEKLKKAMKENTLPVRNKIGFNKFFINLLVHHQPMKSKDELLNDNWLWCFSEYFTNEPKRLLDFILFEPFRLLTNQEGRWSKYRQLSWDHVKELNPLNIMNHDTHLLNRCLKSIYQILEDPIGSNRSHTVRPLNLTGWTRGSELKVISSTLDDGVGHVTHVSSMSKISGPLFSETYSHEVIKRVKVVKEKLFLEIEFRFKFHEQFKIEWDTTPRSILTKDDVSTVPSKYLINENAFYDEEINGLIKAYRSLLKQRNSENFSIIPANEKGLIPLIVPKEVIEVVEKQIRYDRFIIETSGLGTLLSSYTFSLNEETGFYELALVYTFAPINQNEKNSPYCKINIASIDRPCVNAWKNKKGELELDECLIQWLKTKPSSLIGMPGKRSRLIQNGDFIAPAEEPFPGLYNLMKQEPGIIQTFDSSKYESEKDIIHDQPYSLEFFGVDALKIRNHALKLLQQFVDRSTTFEKYKHAYQLVIAYSRLCSSLTVDELSSELDAKLQLLPPSDLHCFATEINFPRKGEPSVMAFEQLMMVKPSKGVQNLRRHNECIRKIQEGKTEMDIFDSYIDWSNLDTKAVFQ